MSGEVKSLGPATGATAYFRILGSGNSNWSTSGGTGGWENYTAANQPQYAVSLTEQGTTNIYVGNFPTAVPAGVFDIVAQQQAGGSAASTDRTFATGQVEWNGSKTLPLSDLATSGQVGQVAPIRMARGIAVSGFPFKLVSSADHVTPFTSGVCSGQISRDGGGFGALQSGAFTEVGLGFYKVNLTSGDLLATTVALNFSANGISGGTADSRDMVIVLQRTSGQ